jgi:uncharacterized protein (TIGR04255 family)
VANALGQMPNAPLIYVLAQIRFSHIPRMDKRWEDFHEKVFETYPKAETERIEEITLKDGQPSIGNSIQRWHMVNEFGSTGIILDAGMLVFHTTDYKTSDVFLSDFESLLEAFIEILPKGVSVSRLGLRYVDLLLKEEDLAVDQQVMEALRLPNLPKIGTAERMEQMVTYQTHNNGTLVIRHRQSATPDVLPADIFPNKLEPAPRLKRKRPENSIVGLLDYDHFTEQNQSFDIDSIIEGFRNLRETSSAAFKATTTKDAFTEWQKELLQ